jgi:hypothetical protein
VGIGSYLYACESEQTNGFENDSTFVYVYVYVLWGLAVKG